MFSRWDSVVRISGASGSSAVQRKRKRRVEEDAESWVTWEAMNSDEEEPTRESSFLYQQLDLLRLWLGFGSPACPTFPFTPWLGLVSLSRSHDSSTLSSYFVSQRFQRRNFTAGEWWWHNAVSVKYSTAFMPCSMPVRLMQIMPELIRKIVSDIIPCRDARQTEKTDLPVQTRQIRGTFQQSTFANIFTLTRTYLVNFCRLKAKSMKSYGTAQSKPDKRIRQVRGKFTKIEEQAACK